MTRRPYLHQSMLEAMKEAGEPVMSHEIKDFVSERMGTPISSRKIGMHMRPLIEEGVVRRKTFQKGYSFYWLP